MHRNARNITLLALAALVLGGVAVASSGAFDTTTSVSGDRFDADADGGADGGSGGEVGLAAPATTMAASFTGDMARESAATAAPAPEAAGGGSASDAIGAQVPVSDGAKIVKTADLTLSIAEGKFSGAFAEASRIASANGGFVVSSSTSTTGVPGGPIPIDDADGSTESSDNRARAGMLTIRVPAERFDTARAALAGLGDVENETINGQDVSSQLVDLDARITNLKAEEQAFVTLLGKATAVGDILQIQDQLFNVRMQIEQLEAEQANLNDQATYSTITVSLYEPGVAFTAAPEPEPSILSKAWDDATTAALNVLGGMVVVLGYAIPLGALALVGWGIWSATGPWRRRRSGEQRVAVDS